MILDTQIALQANGATAKLADILTFILDKGCGDNKVSLQLLRLMDRVEHHRPTELSEDDLKLLRRCVDAQPIFPLAHASILYHLFPAELADSDKDIIERRLAKE